MSCSCGCSCEANAQEVKAVKEAMNTWLATVSGGAPEPVVKLYLEEAVLLPTLSPVICDTTAKRMAYFKVFTANEELRGTIDEIHTRVYGDVAINSGHYTFTMKKNGQTVAAPARFTFVYKKTPQGWMIVEHHSSLQPAGH